MPDVLVVGPVLVERLASGDGWNTRLGGSGLIAALASARTGAETALAGWVGEDDADEAHGLLEAAGVDVSPLKILPGASGIFVLHDPADGVPPAPQYRPFETSPQTLARPALRHADVTVAFGSPDADPIAQGWLDSPEPNTLIWDRQGWLSRARDAQLAALVPAKHRIWLGNIDEARAETGQDMEASAIEQLPPPSFRIAVVKCGPWGVIVRYPDGREDQIGAFAAEGPTAIGTGDAFAGAFAARVALGAAPGDAARWGCAVAAAFLAEPSNLGDRVLERADRLLSTESVFVDRREVALLRCAVRCDPGPTAELVRAAVTARLHHLGLRPSFAADSADLLGRGEENRKALLAILTITTNAGMVDLGARTHSELGDEVIGLVRAHCGRASTEATPRRAP